MTFFHTEMQIMPSIGCPFYCGTPLTLTFWQICDWPQISANSTHQSQRKIKWPDSLFCEMMPKKEATHAFCKKLSRTITFWAAKIEKNFFYKKWVFFVAAWENKNFSNTWPPKSSMGSHFQPRNPKKRSFFQFEGFLGLWGGTQQHHLSRQHFGGHVA